MALFSVVIPTHDRLDLLRDAVDTVLKQDFLDWELVIFDNASTSNLAEYVNDIHDPRIRCERSDDFLPVSDSWNRAIDLAIGDYVTMLGDDDGLTPGYFTKLKQVITDFNSPEVLYSNIYQFLQPGVAPWSPQGYVADLKYAFFFEGKDSPFLLSSRQALKAVQGSIGLRRNFTFNMQAFCFHRSFLRRLREDGPIFRSSFPDYYLANVAFAKAHTIVIIPEPICIAGVTKASFGYTLFNELEEKGAALLNSELTLDPLYHEVEKYLLPGPRYDTNYIITMEHVARYAGSYIGRSVSFGRYRRLQIFKMLGANGGHLGRGTPAGSTLWSRLSSTEKIWTLGISAIIRVSGYLGLYERAVLPCLKRFLEPYAYRAPNKMISRGQYSQLIDFFRSLQPPINAPLASREKSVTAHNKDFEPKSGSIALAYLARMAEGIEPLQKFAESYMRNPAGIKHDLVVIYKGYNRVTALDEAKQVFGKIPHVAFEVSDEGFDINAYVKAAREFQYDYFCFLNTFTEIAVPNWLSHLYRHAVSPLVGIVGAMGSYESLYDSFALINKVMWFCNGLKISYNEKIAHYYDFIINAHCEGWGKNKQSFMARLGQKIDSACTPIRKFNTSLARQHWRDLVVRIRLVLAQWKMEWETKKPVISAFQGKSIDEEFRQMWEFQTGPKGSLTVYSKFPTFPNPHIRSNGFIVSRERFLGLAGLGIKTKYDACIFESGIDSMTNQIRRQGLKAVVVGRNGLGYDLADWVKSGTFRLGNQENLILTDNQSRCFDTMTQGARATHTRMTWGDYLAVAPSDFPDLCFKFATNVSVTGSLVGEPQLREEYDELLSRAYAEARRPYLETIAPIPAHAFHLLSWRYFVEINSGCNLRCTMCIRGDDKGYDHINGFMDQRLFEHILDKIKKENNNADVCLYGNSEPFLHPRLHQCIAAVKQRGLNCLISTNLHFIRNLKETLEARPDVLILSVSGFTQEVYGRAHRGGDIELVKTNMQILAKMRADLGSTVPIQVHYHLYKDNWGDEFERMKAFATDLGFTTIVSWARSISMEKTIQYLRLRERQTCGSVPPLQVSAAGLGPQKDWVSLFPEVTEDFLHNVKRLGITPDEASALYKHYPEPAVCPVGDLFTFIRHDGSVALCACFSDNRLMAAPSFLEVSQEQLSRRRRWHPLCRECLRYKMHLYFHIVDIPMWDRIMAEKFPNIPADGRIF